MTAPEPDAVRVRLPVRFDLRGGFPLVTTKKMHLRSIIYELLWL